MSGDCNSLTGALGAPTICSHFVRLMCECCVLRVSDSERDGCAAVDTCPPSKHWTGGLPWIPARPPNTGQVGCRGYLPALQTLDRWAAVDTCPPSKHWTGGLPWIPGPPSKHWTGGLPWIPGPPSKRWTGGLPWIPARRQTLDRCVAVDTWPALQTLDRWAAVDTCPPSKHWTGVLLWIPGPPSKHLLHKPTNSAVRCKLTLRIDRSGQKKMPSHKRKGRASVAAGSADEETAKQHKRKGRASVAAGSADEQTAKQQL